MMLCPLIRRRRREDRRFAFLLMMYRCNFTELLPPAPMLVVLVMGEVQMMRRLFECLCTNSYSASFMSIPIYLTGISFYCALGVSLLCLMQEESLTVGPYTNTNILYHSTKHVKF